LTTIPTQPGGKRRGFMARYGLGLVLLSNEAKRSESDDRRPAVRPRIPAHLIFPSQHFYEGEGSFIKRPMLFTLIAA